MAKTKYDWHKLKQEFFESDYLEVKGFFEAKFSAYNTNIQEKTAGWTKAKQEYQKAQIQQAEAEYEVEKRKKWKQVFRNIDTARMSWLQEIGARLTKGDKLSKLQVREITEALKHLRLELWESTENVKQDIISKNDQELLDEII